VASRADVDRCSASRASHQQDGFATLTTNSGISSALLIACVNTFPPLHGTFPICAGQPSRLYSGSCLNGRRPLGAGSNADTIGRGV
jgi:hypothetical protein